MKALGLILLLICLGETQAATFKETTFKAITNVSGVSITGEIKKVSGSLKSFEIPLKLLKTGVSLRDKHMRDKIFKNEPILFTGKVVCESKCYLRGSLTIANTTKELSIGLETSGNKYKVSHVVKLSEYNIEAPSFMGVEVRDEVTISTTLHL